MFKSTSPPVAALLVLFSVTGSALVHAGEIKVQRETVSQTTAIPKGTPIYLGGVPGKPRDFMSMQQAHTVAVGHGQTLIRMSDGSIVAKPTPRAPTATRLTTSAALVTTNVTICNAPYEQAQPVAALDGGGGYFVAWTDSRSGFADIFAQGLNSAASIEWGLNGAPVCKGSGNQSRPFVVSDGLGGALVFWQDDRSGTLDIYGQRMSPTGSQLWAPGGVTVCAAVGDQRLTAVIPDGADGAILAWEDDRGGLGTTDVYVQRVDNSGISLWSGNGLAVGAASGTQQLPVLASDELSGAIVAWQDNRGANQDVYAQRVNAAGSVLWTPNGVALCTMTGAQGNVSMVRDGAGGAIAVWEDARTPANGLDVYAQRVDASGGTAWAGDGVALVTMTGDQRKPKTVTDGAGGAVVAWQDFRGGATSDVYVRRIDATGTPHWTSDGVPVCTAVGNQFDVTMESVNGSGSVMVAWSDGRDSGTSGNDIYCQKVDNLGNLLWTADGVAMCNTNGNQDQPAVEPDGVGGAFVVWRDFRNGTTGDIYGQRADANGNLPDQCGAPLNLVSGTSVTASSPSNNYTFNQAEFYWTAIGVRGAPGDDWDMEVYGPGSFGMEPYPVCFGNPVVGSYETGVTDFVVANFNDFHVPPDIYQARAFRYTGAGGGTVEWDDGGTSTGSNPDAIDPTANNNTQSRNTDATDVLECWDVFMMANTTYTVQFRRTGGTAETRVLLFSSFGSPGCSPTDCFYFAPRSARKIEAQHDFIFTTPPAYTDPATEGWFGLVVVNDNGQSGSYTIGVKPGVQTTSVGDAPHAATGLKGMVPNPAKGSMQIQFAMQKSGNVSFQMFDIGGRVVSSIPARSWDAGSWSVAWSGRGANGHRVLPGLYFVQMKVDDRVVGLDRVTLLN